MTEAAEARLVSEAIRDAKAEIDRAKAAGKLVVGVEDLPFSLEEDQTGDPAVIVTALLPENTRDEDWTSLNLDPISTVIREKVYGKEINRFVYVRFTTPSLFNNPTDDPEEA